jgi:hypothetical protein
MVHSPWGIGIISQQFPEQEITNIKTQPHIRSPAKNAILLICN